MSKQLSKFRPATRNANRHTARGMGALQKSIQSDGWIGAMTTAADGEMIAGSARIETAAQVFGTDAEPIIVESDGTRPVVVVRKDIPNADDKRAQRLALADNRVHEIDMSWDVEVLAGMDADVLGDLWTPDELSDLGQTWADEQRGKLEDAEPQIDKAEELRVKWGVESGQLWQLGDHRLICGDCTDKATVDRVMGGERAEFCLTDPPYGIDVVPDSGEIGWSTKQAKVSRFSKVINDDKPMDVSFLLDSADKVAIFGGQYFAHYLPKAGRWLVWDKDFTDAERDFVPFSECELVWSNVPGVSVKKYKCRSMGYSREGESGSRVHPNQKPVNVIRGIICDFSKDCSVIYDPFLGSGTTLIACERLGRKCLAVEISPAYVAVALERWATVTGKTPKLIEDGNQ